MDYDAIIKSMMFECIAPGGFLDQLRAGAFVHTRYNALVEALRNYAALVKGEDVVDRTVAYCLYQIEIEISAALSYYPRNASDVKTIQDAHYELTNLIVNIVTPPSMYGAIPDWLDR